MSQIVRAVESDTQLAAKISRYFGSTMYAPDQVVSHIAAYRIEVTAPLLAALRDLVQSNGYGVGALKNARELLEKFGEL